MFTSDFILPYTLPPNARFTLKQVSASTNETLANIFKYVIVYFPELMSTSNHLIARHFKVNANGVLEETVGDPGLRYYIVDPISAPFAVNAFPNLYLGRHNLPSTHLRLQIKAVGLNNQIAKLYSFSVVLEWDTE